MGVKNNLRGFWPQVVRLFGPRSQRYAGAAGPQRRTLRLEPLEERQMMSVMTTAQTWKTLTGTLTGTYSGAITLPTTGYYTDNFPNASFQETVNLVYADNLNSSSGTAVSTDVAHNHGSGTNSSVPGGPQTGPYTFQFSGNTAVTDNNGQFQHNAGTSTITRDPVWSIGGNSPYGMTMSGTVAPDAGDPTKMVANGSWDSTFQTQGYPAETKGTYQALLQQSGTLDMSVTAARWNQDGSVQFTIQSTGPCVPVANRNAPITYVSLYWADASGKHLASAMPAGDTVGIDWNQASGIYRDMLVAYPGATQLLVVVNEGNNIAGFTETNTANNVFALAGTPPTPRPATTGLYDPVESTFYLRYVNDWGAPDTSFVFHPEAKTTKPAQAWKPFAGDWNGDLVDSIGLYDASASWYHLRNTNNTGADDYAFGFGAPGGGWIPLVGDWDGNGTKTIGAYDPATSMFFLRNSLSSGYGDISFAYGAPGSGWQPIVGDWNGDGVDTVGFFDPKTFMIYLRNTNSTGFADVAFPYGAAGSDWIIIMGDWDGVGGATMGFYLPEGSHFYLRNSNTAGYADISFGMGPPASGWQPVTGRWLAPASLLADQPGLDSTAQFEPLGVAAVQSVFDAALARWAAAGLDAPRLNALSKASFVVADLPGMELGLTVGNTIYLDRDAVGHGWFVDPTPSEDEEFTKTATDSQLKAIAPQAVDRIDLLTVVEHELGHVAGLDDLSTSSDSLMNGRLGTGLRRNPGPQEVDSIFSQSVLVN